VGEGRRFKLLRRLGAGAHGEVYLAEQESQAGFRRRVALKLLRPELGHHDQAARRMRDEARILGRLSHRHIVGVSDLVRVEDRWAVVMDYVPGADLERVLEGLEAAGEAFPPRAAIDVAIAILRALHAAWIVDNGAGAPLKLIHRDIKPSNVLLAEDGALKVLDFGVARVDLGTREAETGAVRPGTLRYMAPERLLGEEEAPSGDVYATAVSVFELLIGEPLGRTPIVEPKHGAYIQDAADRAKARAPDNAALAQAVDILARGMLAEPEERPSAEELARDLVAVVGQLPGEDISTFGTRFLPRLHDLLGETSEPVNGTLRESSSSSSATFLPDADPGAPSLANAEDPDEGGRSSASLGLMGIGIGLAAGLVLLCLAGGIAASFVPGWADGSVEPDPALADPDGPGDDPDGNSGDAGDGGVGQAGAGDESTTDPGAADTDAQADTGAADTDVAVASGTSDPGSADSETSGTAEETTGSGTSGSSGGSDSGSSDSGGSSGSGGSGSSSGTADDPVVAPDAPRVSAAMFILPEASALEVTCGDVRRVGTASVRLRDLPAGTCRVKATYLGKSLTTSVQVDSRREVRCAIQDGSLACR